jgi:hypothetical protein
MCKLSTLVLVITSGAFASEPCRTASGVPCFTLIYQHSLWALVKSPVRNLVTAELTGTMAVRADGSTVHRWQPVSRFAARGATEPLVTHTRIYLASPPRLITGGPPEPSDSRLPQTFFAELAYLRTRPGSGGNNCRAIIESFAKGPALTGKGKLHGEPVVNWKFKFGWGEASVAIAPDLDCQVVRFEAVEYRYGYLPVRKELFEVKAIQHGEPAASLFEAPKGK